MSDVIVCDGISKIYTSEAGRLPVLREVAFTIRAGEMAALVGPSGAGKSTLLHICGLLDQPSGGDLRLLGEAAASLNDRQRTALRRRNIGFVYQSHRLLPEFSARENIMLPQLIAGVDKAAAAVRADALLDQVGLLARASHRPGKLSGGEQQRVAICRALANEPRLLIADEPTGNLDPTTGGQIFALFRRLAAETGVATLLATHNMELARQADRVLELRNGSVVSHASGAFAG